MGRIEERFTVLKGKEEMALICYLTAGYPDRRRFIDHAMACLEGGADMIEVGVPYSDPVADGPVIQATSEAALRQGVRPRAVLELVSDLRARTEAPIILMGYYNPIFRLGESRFVHMASESGADGIIVPDLPLEESRSLMRACGTHRLDLIQLVAPTTTVERMGRIASSSSGYLYLVSRLGITGSGTAPGSDLGALLRRTKSVAGDLPVAAGFGISTPEQVARLQGMGADGAIVGSAIMGRLMQGKSPESIMDYVRSLKEACLPI